MDILIRAITLRLKGQSEHVLALDGSDTIYRGVTIDRGRRGYGCGLVHGHGYSDGAGDGDGDLYGNTEGAELKQ